MRFEDACTAENLRVVGEQMIALGSLDHRAFKSQLRRFYVQSRLQLIAQLQRLTCNAPLELATWKSEIAAMIDDIWMSFSKQNNIVLSDLASIIGVEQAQVKVQI